MSSTRRRSVARRSALVALVASLAVVGSTTPSFSVSQEGNLAPFAKIACQAPHEILLRTWRGLRLDRSGDIQIISQQPSFVTGGLTHATPWPYTQDVPIFWYGAPWVKDGMYKQPVTSADIAPTEAQFLNFNGFHAPDGKPMTEALLPASQRQTPPRLFVQLVWDSGGMDVLDHWKTEWPYLKSLMPHGAWFTNATVGSSPSNTPTIHATIGTGAYPDHHGMNDEYIRIANTIEKPNANGPAFLLDPTFADIYDRAMGNKPIVGGVATLSAHLSFLSHGSMWGGGDKDIAVTRENTHGTTAGAEAISWNLTPAMAPFYRMPSYVNHISNLQKYVDQIDRSDGKIDQAWMGTPMTELNGGFDSPARTPYQTDLIKAIIQREGFGQDSTPDFLAINYKAIDTVGHLYSLDSPQMKQTLQVQDQNLKVLVDFLNHQVGKDKWMMVLTADHGTQRDPHLTGAYLPGVDQITAALNAKFGSPGKPVVQELRPTEVWLDHGVLAENGYTVADVATYMNSMTESDVPAPSTTIQPGNGGDPAFLAVFPSAVMSQLPCLPEARA